MSNELPVWLPWVSKEVHGKQSEWKIAQINKFLNILPNAVPKHVQEWLENKDVHPTNPFPANNKKISKLLSKARSRKRSRSPSKTLQSEAPDRKKRKKPTNSTSSVGRAVQTTLNAVKDFTPDAMQLFCEALSKKIPGLQTSNSTSDKIVANIKSIVEKAKPRRSKNALISSFAFWCVCVFQPIFTKLGKYGLLHSKFVVPNLYI